MLRLKSSPSSSSSIITSCSSTYYQDDCFEDFHENYKKMRVRYSPFKTKKQIKINVWSGAESENSPYAGQRSPFDLALDIFISRLKLERDCPPILPYTI